MHVNNSRIAYILNIKTIFYIFLLLILMPIMGHADEPDWFAERSIETQYNTEKIGYGHGTTKEEAYLAAVDELSKQIEGLEVINVFECTKNQKIITENNNNRSRTTNKQIYIEECKKNLVITANLKLKPGTEIVRTMHQEGEKNKRGKRADVYYVAIKYDDADIIVKTARLHENVGTGCKDDTDFIPFEREVRQSIAEQFKKNNVCMLSWNLSVIDKSIDTKTPKWQLKMGTFSFVIANYKELRDKFWPTEQQSEYLQLSLSKTPIFHGMSYHIELELNDTLNNYYANPSISVFSVTERGQVITLIKNKPSASFVNNEMQFPDPRDNADLITEVPEEKDITHELFLATICTKNLPMLQFIHIDKQLAPDTKGYDYGRLLEIIKFNHCRVSAHPIVVKHKQ